MPLAVPILTLLLLRTVPSELMVPRRILLLSRTTPSELTVPSRILLLSLMVPSFSILPSLMLLLFLMVPSSKICPTFILLALRIVPSDSTLPISILLLSRKDWEYPEFATNRNVTNAIINLYIMLQNYKLFLVITRLNRHTFIFYVPSITVQGEYPFDTKSLLSFS